METFNNHDSWAAMGRHALAPPVLTLDEETKSSFNLNSDDLYVVTLEGKTRVCTFERWHGQHALFYSHRDDWRLIIHYAELRRLVKRKKA
jgi:hypothetical protein